MTISTKGTTHRQHALARALKDSFVRSSMISWMYAQIVIGMGSAAHKSCVCGSTIVAPSFLDITITNEIVCKCVTEVLFV